jgi:anti-anti-sigma factor
MSDLHDGNLLRFTRNDDLGRIVLVGEGEIDVHTVAILRDAADDAIVAGAPRIDMDLARVTFSDSAGVRGLAEARVAAEARGIRLTIVDLSPPVRRILEISGLYELLTS